jgi:AcrR family transcriptional regulator
VIYLNKKNNTRYKNTETMIKKVFLEQLEIKDIRYITIREICENANINRSTFYEHYQDIYDLLDKIEDKLSKELIKKFEDNYTTHMDTKLRDYINTFLKFVIENKVFYKNFINSQQSFPIKRGFDKLLDRFVIPYYQNQGILSEDEIIYRFVFMQAGFTMVLKRWLNNDCKESNEKMANIILSCIIK